MRGKNILLTGGAGYIGAVLLPGLLEAGYKVRLFDRFYFGEEPIKQYIEHPNLQVIKGDLRYLDKHPDLLDDIDTIIHLGSLSNDPSCDLREDLSLDINFHATIELAKRAKSKGVRQFIFMSTCSVYGAAGDLFVTEQSELHPVSLYAKTKLWAEEAIMELRDSDFHPVCLRQATVCGLSPRMRFDLAINVMTLYAKRKGLIYVFGGGKQWRPFIHVQDSSRIILQLLKLEPRIISGEFYNMGFTSMNYRIAELARLVADTVGEVRIEELPGDPDTRSYRVNFDKLHELLGLEPQFDAKSTVMEIADALDKGIFGDTERSIFYNIRLMKELLAKPAIAGGETSRTEFLPFSKPLLGKEEENEVLDTLRSGWITTGPKTHRFEEKCKEYLGCDHAIALSSCTAALHLALVASGIGAGDEVITSPITFASTVNVIVHCGAKPVFVDIKPDTLNIDASKIEAAITEHTRAIIPVDMAGQPCELDQINELAQKHDLVVIEDAAHGIGSMYKGKMVGDISDFTAFSFYPIKNMTTIEGGLLVFKDADLEGKLRMMSLHGLSRDAWNRYTEQGSIHWEIEYPGFKYNMTDVSAAIGLHQLDRLEGFLQTRKRYARMYDDAFSQLDGIIPLRSIMDIRHSHHLYIIKLDTAKISLSRDEFIQALKAENIGSGIHFRAVHLHPYYRRTYGFKPGKLPIAEDVSQRILSLPLYPAMTERDISQVIDTVSKLCRYYAR